MTLEDAVKSSESSSRIISKKEYLDEKFSRMTWKILGIFVAACFIITRFIFPVYAVGQSMEPTIHDGSVLICYSTVKEYHVDDIVMIRILNGTPFPLHIIKRIVAVPGDSVEISGGALYVNGIKEDRGFDKMEDAGFVKEQIILGRDEYFVLGDNRNYSSDSREYGVINGNMIKGILSEWSIDSDP